MTSRRPLVGITAYEKVVDNQPTIVMTGVMSDYKDALLAVGALPVMIPLGLDEDGLLTVLDRLDALLVPGGGDIAPSHYGGDESFPTLRGIDPRRDEMEIWAVRAAVARDMPLLAICRGHQMFNVALGGTLWEDVGHKMPDAITHDFYAPGVARDVRPHAVQIVPDSRLAHLLGRTETLVNSLHHQGVRELGSGLRASGFAPDGLVEGLELPDHRFAVSVQWHPENLVRIDPAMLGLFRGLVEAASG